MNMQEYPKAKQYFTKCVDNYSQNYETSVAQSFIQTDMTELLQCDIYNNLAIVSEHLLEFDDSINYYNLAIQIYKTHDN